MEQILAELEEYIHSRGIFIGMATRVTKEALKEHIGPSRDINFITSFLAHLKREMGPLTRDATTYEVS
jgi:hypothetical protein